MKADLTPVSERTGQRTDFGGRLPGPHEPYPQALVRERGPKIFSLQLFLLRQRFSLSLLKQDVVSPHIVIGYKEAKDTFWLQK